MQHHQAIIVGAGPIGLELAVCLRHAGTDVLHLEAAAIGQTITWYPKQARFFSSPERIAIAGVPLVSADQAKASREEYLAYLRSVVQQFELPIATHEPVRQIARDATTDTFTIKSSKRSVTCDHLVLAIGDMHQPRRINVPGEDLPHVSHYFDEPHAYFGRALLIVGGRNSAVEAALRCHRAGAKVSISYRGQAFSESSIKYWLLPEIKALIKHGQIRFYPQTIVKQITDTRVELQHTEGGEARDIPADHVLLLTGYQQDQTLLRMAGVELTGENLAPSVDPHTMQTSVPNLYIAGTAAAGTQNRFKLFIENCHSHAAKIATAITGQAPPGRLINDAAKTYGLAES
ncbi:MAG: NAD(P)-binding domain-containing protein [Planctomycetota bacterium]